MNDDPVISAESVTLVPIAASSVRGGDLLRIAPPRPTKFVIDGVVTLHRDGRVELGEGVTPDDAARAFWAAVQRIAPYMGEVQ